MFIFKKLLAILLLILLILPKLFSQKEINLIVLKEFALNSEVGALRAIPVKYGEQYEAILFAWSKDKDIDPFIEMFYPLTDKMKFALYSIDGELIWI